MPGINDSTLVYGVLDLIKKQIELNKNASSMYTNSAEGDPLSGTPSIILEREHPDDDEVLTGAQMFYDSGWITNVQLVLGMTDDEIAVALAKNQHSDGNIDIPVIDNPNDQLPSWNKLSEDEQSPTTTVEEDSFSDFGGGLDDSAYTPVLPGEVKDETHPDYEFYTKWRLNKVFFNTTDSEGTIVDSYTINLLYDYRSFLTSTIVERI